jgi:hypothetical protein
VYPPPRTPKQVRVGRARADAVSRWLPTAAARVRARIWSSRICGGQNGAEAGYLRVLRFFPAKLHSAKFSILTITRGRHNRPVNGRRAEWTQFGLHSPLCELKKYVGLGKFLLAVASTVIINSESRWTHDRSILLP